MVTRRAPAAWLAGLILVLLAPAAGASTAPQPLEVRVEQLVAQPDGVTRMTVAVSGLPEGGVVELERLEVVENGDVVDFTVAEQSEVATPTVAPAVVVAVDVSGSTEGQPIEAARAAATQLVTTLTDAGALVGVVAFGANTSTVADLSTDATAALDGIAALQARGGTALYDGVSRAARMLAGHDGPRDVVVFSDGEDTTSGSSLDDVRALLDQTDVRVTSVLLQSDGVAVAPLQAMSALNGGRFIEVADAGELATAFEAVAGDLTNRLEITWRAEPIEGPAPLLSVVATYRSGDVVASDGVQVENPRLPALTAPRPVEVARPLVPLLADETGLVTASVATGLALLVALVLTLTAVGDRRRRGELDRRLSSYQAGVGEQGREDRQSLSDRASSALDIIPRPSSFDRNIARAIEQADWPMRVSEFLLLTFSVGLLGFVIGAVLIASASAAVLLTAIGLALPWVVLRVAVSRRQAAFAEQLPTVLQVLAGALRAGHGFSTALDGAVSEVDEPARSELRRASVEARLGRPMDRALHGVAERMDSEDLLWVIGALEVQREVGGNLAEILHNVAATLRDRASVVRHVKSLTAEGRLSAVFIGAMPVVLFALLNVLNPEYVALLFDRPIGRLMLAAGALLMLAGIVVLRRLVRPQY